jgi:hypothetical protein
MKANEKNDVSVLWLAPLVATLPLIAFCCLPASPWFLGRLMDEPSHPMNQPVIGPLISAMAVVFDGQILAGLMVLLLVAPAFIGLRANGRISTRNILALTGAAGVVASQIARLIVQNVRQADLRLFANSWESPVIGCICGLAAGAFIAYFMKRRIARPFAYLTPIAAQALAAVILIAAAKR